MRWSWLLALVLLSCQRDPPPRTEPCGDKEVMARFAACRATRDKKSCRAAGGIWAQIGFTEKCSCDTGQAGCTCTRKEDCLGACRVSDGKYCGKNPRVGRCTAAEPNAGCRCNLLAPGHTMSYCAD